MFVIIWEHQKFNIYLHKKPIKNDSKIWVGGVPHHTWQSWRSVSCWQKSSRAAPTRHQSETGSDTWLATRTAPGAPFCCFCFPVRLLFSGSSFIFRFVFYFLVRLFAVLVSQLFFLFHVVIPQDIADGRFCDVKGHPIAYVKEEKSVFFLLLLYNIYVCTVYML